MDMLTSVPESDSGAHAPRRGGPGVAMVCLGVAGLIALLFSAMSPALPRMAAEYGHGGDGAFLAQIVFSLSSVMMIVGAIAAGLVNERIGRRRILLGGVLAYAVAGVAGMVAPGIVALGLTRAVAGLASGMMLTGAYATVGEYYEGDARERILGLISMFSSLCSVSLFIVGGMIVDRFGWRAMFGLYALALLLLPPIWLSLGHARARAPEAGEGWSRIVPLWPLYLMLVAYTILIYMTTVQSPFLLAARGFSSAARIGELLAVTSVFGAVSSFLYGYLRRIIGFAALLAYASLLGGGGMVLAGLVPGVGAYVAAAVAIGMGIGVIEPAIASEILRRSPERLHDRAMGLNLGAMFLGQFLNPLVMGPLRLSYGIAAAFAIVGAAFCMGGVAFLAGIRRR
jgi:MFS family permease